MPTPATIEFDRGTANLLLSLRPEDCATSIHRLRDAAVEMNLTPKTEFHITVIGYGAAKEIQSAIKESGKDRKEIMNMLSEIATATEWEFSFTEKAYGLEKEYQDKRTKEREARRSIIQLVTLPGLETFYKSVNDLLGTAFEAPFPHVTVYTGGTDPVRSKDGIGVRSEADLDNLHATEVL